VGHDPISAAAVLRPAGGGPASAGQHGSQRGTAAATSRSASRYAMRSLISKSDFGILSRL